MGMYKNDNNIYLVLGVGMHQNKNGTQYVDLSLQLDNDGCNRSGTWTITRTIQDKYFQPMLQAENLSINTLKGKKLKIYQSYNQGQDGLPGYYSINDIREIK